MALAHKTIVQQNKEYVKKIIYYFSLDKLHKMCYPMAIQAPACNTNLIKLIN